MKHKALDTTAAHTFETLWKNKKLTKTSSIFFPTMKLCHTYTQTCIVSHTGHFLKPVADNF